MTHIDLFSGIGGFAYAARQVWPDYRNLFFCDTNIFCQAVIRKNFGSDSLIYGDIREVTVERVIADTAQSGQLREAQPKDDGTNSAGWRGYDPADKDCHIDLLTGGFPCQPFSHAGKRKGRDDDRHLWPEMYRVIKAFSPRWVIGENVRGLINIENGMALEQVFLDLEGIGYAVQAFVIPACAVNAPHRRDRIWIVAHAERPRAGSERGEIANEGRETGENRGKGIRPEDGAACSMRPAAADRHAADASDEGLQGNERSGTLGQRPGASRPVTEFTWNDNWLEVATRLCRVDDGLPAGVDGLKLSKSKHREERLKALGNAIVPQVVMEIMKSIKCTGGIM